MVYGAQLPIVRRSKTPQFGVFCQPQHVHGDYWMLKLSCYCGLLLNSLTDTVEPAYEVHGCKVNFCFKHGEGHMRTEYECVSVHTKLHFKMLLSSLAYLHSYLPNNVGGHIVAQIC